MIIFKHLRFKNFLSTGNVFTEIPLNQHKTTIISGKNGAGKSTILDAMTFVLYNKAFRKITKAQLPNTTNKKDCVVEVEFDTGGSSYKVIRSIGPDSIQIWKNGELVPPSKDYQDLLENTILKMNYKSFTQIVVLGSATYTPFMELKTEHRREFIDDLLDLQVFSSMKTLLTKEVSTNGKEILECETTLRIAESKLETALDYTAKLQEQVDGKRESIKSSINSYVEDGKVLTDKIAKKKKEAEAISEKIPDKAPIVAKIRKAEGILSELNVKIQTAHKDVKFFEEHDDCPVCRQAIDADFKKTIIDDASDKIVTVADAQKTLKSKIAEFDNQINEIDNKNATLAAVNREVESLQFDLRIVMNTLSSLKKELEGLDTQTDVSVDSDKIEVYRKEISEERKKLETLYKHKEVLAFASAMLKDNGIKAQMIKKYVPVINKLVNKHLASFEQYIDFNIDENFDEVIKSRHRDKFSYTSFSQGEKMRINLSLLFTWRAIAKMRNSASTNLLIMDETLDGAADFEGIESLIGILREMTQHDNVFVISHRGEQFGDKFDHHINFKKEKGFSLIE